MRGLALSVLVLLPVVVAPHHGQAQAQAGAAHPEGSPAAVADEFHRAIQSMVWQALADRLHPEALDYLRLAVRINLDADTTGWSLEHLLGGLPDRAAYEALDDEAAFVRVMAGVQTEVPGLLSSMVSRRSEVLGTVVEGQDTAHVVYRIVSLAQGAEPRVRALTLVRTSQGWKVRFAEEVEVLHTALRRIPIPRPPPGQPSGPVSGRVTPG